MGSRQCGMCSHRNRIDAVACEGCGASLVSDPDKLTVTVDPGDSGETPVIPAGPAAVDPHGPTQSFEVPVAGLPGAGAGAGATTATVAGATTRRR